MSCRNSCISPTRAFDVAKAHTLHNFLHEQTPVLLKEKQRVAKEAPRKCQYSDVQQPTSAFESFENWDLCLLSQPLLPDQDLQYRIVLAASRVLINLIFDNKSIVGT